ncbi:MAG: CerR family C-terminal domain-containing protein [Syntrophaceae bacterium]
MNSGSKAKKCIIEAAGEIFSERGFRNTTVREICSRAGVNVAAINYHFGDKEHLYSAVLKHYQVIAFEKYPPGLGVNETDLPDVRLRAYVQSFMFRILDDGQPSWFGKLMAREFIDPTQALDDLVIETIRPSFNILSSIVRELLGNQAGERTIRLCSMSIVGQCLYFRNSKAVLRRFFQKEAFSAEEIKEVADHIAKFSLYALKNYLPIKKTFE